jgi:AP-1 complex subunit beta-1
MCGFTQAAKDVVLAEKPVISDDSNQLDSSLLDELLANISTLSSVYHKPPEAFISRVKAAPRADDEEFADAGEAGYSESPSQGVDGASPSSSTGTSSNVPVKQPAAPAPIPDLLGDLMGLDNALVPVDEPTALSGSAKPLQFLLEVLV